MIDFVITARTRSGMHMLASGLNQLPTVYCWGELFNRDYTCPARVARCPTSDTAVRLMYRRFTPAELGCTPQAVGCLIQDRHVGITARWGSPHEAIIRVMPDVRLIRVVRQEHLARYVSLEEARQTNVWQLWREEERVKPYPFNIRITELLEWLQAEERQQEYHDYVMAGRPCCTVHYEEMLVDFDAVMRRVCDFLDQPEPPAGMKPGTLKISTQPLWGRVFNLRAVVKALEGTKWAPQDLPASFPDCQAPRPRMALDL